MGLTQGIPAEELLKKLANPAPTPHCPWCQVYVILTVMHCTGVAQLGAVGSSCPPLPALHPAIRHLFVCMLSVPGYDFLVKNLMH